MKLPKWTRKPQTVVAHPHNTYMSAAKLLEIEARFYRQVGNKDGSRALEKAAESFRRMGGNGETPDVAFGWAEEEGKT